LPANPPRGSIGGLAFDPAGTQLAVAVNRQLPRRPGETERRWRHEVHVCGPDPAATGVTVPVSGYTHVLAFNNGGTRIAVTGGVDGDTAAEVFDPAAGKPVYRFEPPGTVTRVVLFLPDDRLVVANGRNVYLLPAGTPEPPLTLAGHPKQVNAVALTPDAARLLTASHDGSIRVWRLDTGATVSGFDWRIGPVTAVAFAPDGLTCAAAGLNGKVVVWDVDG
jgi:WD40 repeat protein